MIERMIPETTDCPRCGHLLLLSSWHAGAIEPGCRNWVSCRVQCPTCGPQLKLIEIHDTPGAAALTRHSAARAT
jgi:ssDNA-binding Zn-finger/Zn-ribbon topoisomerase 1